MLNFFAIGAEDVWKVILVGSEALDVEATIPIPFDAELAQRMSDKAVNILKASAADELMPRLSNDQNYYECKICCYQNRCWEKNKEES